MHIEKLEKQSRSHSFFCPGWSLLLGLREVPKSTQSLTMMAVAVVGEMKPGRDSR